MTKSEIKRIEELKEMIEKETEETKALTKIVRELRCSIVQKNCEIQKIFQNK
jgi:HD-like signal output (HDOD) protein